MNNLKKGLAVVLAAATAFTFAPVANFTATAQAEETKDTTEVSYTFKDQKKHVATNDEEKKKDNDTIYLDTAVDKTAQISVANTSAAIYYVPEDATVVRVSPDATGSTATVTALKADKTNIGITVGKSHYTIPVEVSDTATDVVTAQVNGKDVDADGINLDLSTSTAANAVKSVKITGASKNGLPVKYDLYNKETDTKPVSGNSNNIASVASDGTVTAGKSDGSVYVKVYTDTDNGKKITGNSVWVKVTVNSKPEAVINAPSEIRLDFKNNSKVDLSKIISTNAKNATISYDRKAYDKQNIDAITVIGNELSASKLGEATLVITVKGSDTRDTTKEVTVSVVDEITKAVPTITVDANVRLTVGATSALNAKTTATGAALTYVSDNDAVASVDGNGVVTAKGAGVATITITSSATDDFEEGIQKMTVIVDAQPAPVVKPAKVTNLKVKDKKGAKVLVTWKSQGGNVLYRVYKKVGNSKKWVGKNVTSAKASFSVKKGATVKIKVKAFVKDTNGKTVWGPKATVSKSFKTDRK